MGGAGGVVTVITSGTINAPGPNSAGIFVQSSGGRGGDGGNSAIFADVGNGAGGGSGGVITVNNTADITALSDNSSGIVATSVGGSGGNGGSCGTLCFGGGGGGPTGLGGTISVTSSGIVYDPGRERAPMAFLRRASAALAGRAAANNVACGCAALGRRLAKRRRRRDGHAFRSMAASISTVGLRFSGDLRPERRRRRRAGGTGIGLFYGAGGCGTEQGGSEIRSPS